MAAQGHNQGFHVLDEFVCEAIHAPSVPLANPANHGQNDGMSVVEELVFEACSEPTSDEPEVDDARQVMKSHILKRAGEFGMTARMEAALSLLLPPKSTTHSPAARPFVGSVLSRLAERFEATGLDKPAPCPLELPDGVMIRWRTARGAAKATLTLLFHIIYDAIRNPSDVSGGPVERRAAVEVFSGLMACDAE